MPPADTLPDLNRVLKSVESEKRIGFDLEADSMYHFSEKVCLVQVASKNDAFVIDTVKLRDLSLLKPLFMNEDIMKIFHGADYDVRSLFRDFGIEIRNLFDTELASRFLGVKETGLDAVLKNRFGVTLEKKYQKKDWSERPISADMLHYALNDVIHLVGLSEILEKELEAAGRISWVKEECEILSRVRPPEDDKGPLFLKFKGAGRLKSRNLAVLEALLQFRLESARKKDRPLFKIMGNDSILKLAETCPESPEKMVETGALTLKQADIYGRSLNEIIKKALKTPADLLPVYPRKKTAAISEKASKRIDLIRKWRDKKAKRLGIEPGLLLNKSLVNLLGVRHPASAGDMDEITDMKNWQKSEFGEEIIGILKRGR